MTQEEKAQRYDEAIEKLRSLHDDYDTVSTLIDIKEELENIFPELKESEDEQIRKELLEHCINRRDGKQVCVDANDYRRWADWLEKQGEQKSIDDLTQQEAMDIAVAKCFEQGEQKPAFEMKTPEESLGIDSDTYNKIVDECIYGEQKPA